jgi:hypothetical protein
LSVFRAAIDWETNAMSKRRHASRRDDDVSSMSITPFETRILYSLLIRKNGRAARSATEDTADDQGRERDIKGSVLD